MVDFSSAYTEHTRECALAVCAVIAHVAYVIEVQHPDAGQTDRDAASYDFGRQCLRLQVISAERAE